jgi:WD40 repeat protein
VRVWDVQSGRLLRSLPNAHGRIRASVDWGEGVAFVGDNRIAVAPWSHEGRLPSAVVAKVFDLSSGKEVSVVKDPAGPTQTVDIDVSPDGKLLVAGHQQGPLHLYRLSDGRQLDVVQNGSRQGAMLDVEFSHDGKLVATGGVDGLAKIWSVANGKLREVLRLRGHANPVGSVSFNRDGTRLVSWGQLSGEARVWDVSPAGPGEVLTLPGPQSEPEYSPDVAFTPNGRRLVASSGPAGTVRVWSVRTGKELLRLDQGATDRARAHAVIGIDVSPDGTRIATAGADGSVRIFDAVTGKQLLALRHQHCVPHGQCVVNRAVFSPDGSTIATTGYDATIGILDARSGRRLRRPLRGHKPGSLGTFVVEWSRDGRRLLSTAHDGMRIWDVRTGRKLLALPPGGGPGGSGAWSPDDKKVLTESGQGPQVWDASTGRKLRLLATGSVVTGLVFSRNGRRLAIGTIDESASTRIWDWPSGVEALKLPELGRGLAFSPDGKLLAGVEPEPVPFVHVWTLDPKHLLQIARSRVTRSLTAEECRRYLQRPCSNSR